MGKYAPKYAQSKYIYFFEFMVILGFIKVRSFEIIIIIII